MAIPTRSFSATPEGNLHFVFTQDFNAASEIVPLPRLHGRALPHGRRKYDGSLAEHGTGRNIAPRPAEWATKRMHSCARQAALDPNGLLNPGVILNDDPDAHIKHLKPLPACDPIVDKCIECGFCEVKCPSHGLTLSPRQRIVGWREIARLEGGNHDAHEMRELYDYHGIDTCAACGLCATACPVGIETDSSSKAFRGGAQVLSRAASPTSSPTTMRRRPLRSEWGSAQPIFCTDSSERAR
jgi:D-lactate dehydrogenase